MKNDNKNKKQIKQKEALERDQQFGSIRETESVVASPPMMPFT